MSTFTITLPTEHVIESRTARAVIATEVLTPEIVAKLALHGLTQKIGDAAASALADCGHGKAGDGKAFGDLTEKQKAAVIAKAQELMSGAADALAKGEWSDRTPGKSVDPVVARMRVLFGALLREGGKDAKAVWAEVKDAEDKGDKLDALIAAQGDDFAATLRAEAEAAIEAEKATKARVGKLMFNVKL